MRRAGGRADAGAVLHKDMCPCTGGDDALSCAHPRRCAVLPGVLEVGAEGSCDRRQPCPLPPPILPLTHTSAPFSPPPIRSDANIYIEEGTRENPIPILSTEAERVVGISLPDDAEVRWCIVRENELLYDPDTANYFALRRVTQSEVDAWVAKAEQIAFGKK